MTNFWAVMTNSTFIAAYGHVLAAAFLTGAVFMLGIAAYHLRKGNDLAGFGKAARVAMVVTVLMAIFTMFLGDNQAKEMEVQQPMKMAAAEALYNTQSGASFSLLTIGNLKDNAVFQVRVPHILSVLATNTWDGKVKGINQLQKEATKKLAPVATCRSSGSTGRFASWSDSASCCSSSGPRPLAHPQAPSGEVTRFLRFATWMIAAPFIANTFGWIFTEVGRQPWVVYGLFRTSKAVTLISPGYVATSLIGFTAIYTLLAIIEIGLMFRIAKVPPAIETPAEAERVPELIY